MHNEADVRKYEAELLKDVIATLIATSSPDTKEAVMALLNRRSAQNKYEPERVPGFQRQVYVEGPAYSEQHRREKLLKQQEIVDDICSRVRKHSG